jgi:hypothetical protein
VFWNFLDRGGAKKNCIPDDTKFWAEWPKFIKSPLPFQVPYTRRSVAGNGKGARNFSSTLYAMYEESV